MSKRRNHNFVQLGFKVNQSFFQPIHSLYMLIICPSIASHYFIAVCEIPACNMNVGGKAFCDCAQLVTDPAKKDTSREEIVFRFFILFNPHAHSVAYARYKIGNNNPPQSAGEDDETFLYNRSMLRDTLGQYIH